MDFTISSAGVVFAAIILVGLVLWVVYRNKRKVILAVALCLTAVIIIAQGCRSMRDRKAANQQTILDEFPPGWRALFLEITRVRGNSELEMVLITGFLKQDDLPMVGVYQVQHIMKEVNQGVTREWLIEAFAPYIEIPKIRTEE